jgi:hypothetical protein
MSTVPMNLTSTPRVVVASWIVFAFFGAVVVAATVLASIYAGVAVTDVVIGP